MLDIHRAGEREGGGRKTGSGYSNLKRGIPGYPNLGESLNCAIQKQMWLRLTKIRLVLAASYLQNVISEMYEV